MGQVPPNAQGASVHLSDTATRQMVLQATVLHQAGGPSVLEHMEHPQGTAEFWFAPGTGPLRGYHRAPPLTRGEVLEAHTQRKLKLRIFLMQIFKKWSRNLTCSEHETSASSQSQDNSTASLTVRIGKVPSTGEWSLHLGFQFSDA